MDPGSVDRTVGCRRPIPGTHVKVDDDAPEAIDWTTLWRQVAMLMAEHYTRGRAHLLTEDVLRFSTIRALEEAGIAPSKMNIEASLPAGARGHLDLQLGRDAAIEFKFPRDPQGDVSSADTMTLGELLADVYRLASLPHHHRIAVWLLADRLAGYLLRAAARYGIVWPSDTSPRLRLDAGLPTRLPATAATPIASSLVAFQEGVTVEAARSQVLPVAPGVHLVVLQVTAPGPSAWPSTPVVPQRLPAVQGEVARDTAPRNGGTREGARREIHSAIDAICARTRTEAFSPADVVAEMRRRGTGYAHSTIMTMVTSHLCLNAPGGCSWPDLERLDRGLYRRRQRPTA